MIAQSKNAEEIVDGRSYGEAEDEWRNFGIDPPGVPHHRKGERGNENAEWLDRIGMRQHEGEWLRLIQAADVGQLHEKQERGRGVLEAGKHRMRGKPEHDADFGEAEERLEDSAKENRREEHQQDGGDAGGVQHSRFGVDQAVEKRNEEKSAVDTRG